MLTMNYKYHGCALPVMLFRASRLSGTICTLRLVEHLATEQDATWLQLKILNTGQILNHLEGAVGHAWLPNVG